MTSTGKRAPTETRGMDAAERRSLWLSLYRDERAKLTPNCDGGRLSGAQVAYAKGRAGMRFKELGL